MRDVKTEVYYTVKESLLFIALMGIQLVLSKAPALTN